MKSKAGVKVKINLSLPEDMLKEVEQVMKDNFGIDQSTALLMVLSKGLKELRKEAA